MFPDYRSRIIEDYLKKREAKKLPLNLTNPSPARLRDECIIVCTERHDRKDERTLRAFFGEGADKKSCLQAIARLPIDRYKPLSNFLKKLQGGTEYKNIELLAWLIDYDNRPWDLGKTFDPPKPDGRAPEADASLSIGPAAKPTRKKKYYVMAVAAALMTTIGIGTFWVWGNQPLGGKLTGNESCMYWVEDHYEPISCNQQIPGAWVIALDSVKLNSFKKITRPDTITRRSIGVVWCIKIKGEYEYFTSNGFYPLDPKLVLKPLSAFIFKNHLPGPHQSTDPQVESRHF